MTSRTLQAPPGTAPRTGSPAGGKPAGRPWPKRLMAVLMLPREHGAWAMLSMAYLVGAAAAGWGGWPSFLQLVATLLVFSSSRPLEVALQGSPAAAGSQGSSLTPRISPAAAHEARERRRHALALLAVYLGLAGAAGVLLLLAYQRWALLAIGGAAAVALAVQPALARRRLDRTWPARLLSIAALSAAGPAAYYAATGVFDQRAVAVGLLAFLYSGASIFYVRLYYRPPARQKPGDGVDGRAGAELHMAAYLAVAATATAALSALGWLPPLGLAALVPLALKAVRAFRRRDHRPTLRQIGMAELGHTTLFAALAVAAITAW